MKKLVSLLMAVLFLCGATVTAWAVPVKQEPLESDATGKTFTITYNAGAENAGKQYVLMVVRQQKGTELGSEIDFTTLDESTLLYIDQTAADENGVATFEGLQLKSHTSANIYISGEGFTKPTHIGYIEVQGVSVQFTVTLVPGDNGQATVKLLDPDGNEVLSGESENGGTGQLDSVQAGTYDVRIEKPGYLPVTVKGIEVEDTLPEVDLQLYGGDFNGDGKVDYNDLNLLVGDYNHSGSTISKEVIDINGDGVVNYIDLNILVGGYNKGDKGLDAQGRPIGVVIGN